MPTALTYSSSTSYADTSRTLIHASGTALTSHFDRRSAERDRPGKRHPSVAYTDPPIDPLAAAAVFGIAEQILTTDYDATFAVFNPLITRARSAEPAMAHLQRALYASRPLQITLSHHRHDVWGRGTKRLAREHPELVPMPPAGPPVSRDAVVETDRTWCPGRSEHA
ncbi:hypothetical protein [Streptomyces sp. NPDC088246]|uniref:hypothetical protein n=1 Tax=Streptomyces sp. NPDC088246 TaxID=3365842 RepID=UPI0038166650